MQQINKQNIKLCVALFAQKQQNHKQSPRTMSEGEVKRLVSAETWPQIYGVTLNLMMRVSSLKNLTISSVAIFEGDLMTTS